MVWKIVLNIASCWVFYYSDNDELVGVSAIKTKSQGIVKAIRLKAGISDDENPKYELGYSVTKRVYRKRGINRSLNDRLLQEVGDEKVYSTTDNDTMRKYLSKKGFIKKGESFKGKYNENLKYFER